MVWKLESRNPAPVDVKVFGDPVAKTTDWNPLKPGGSSFRAHHLVRDRGKLLFRASVDAKVFAGAFFFVGLAVAVGVVLAVPSEKGMFSWKTLLPVSIGLIFALVSGLMFYVFTNPVVFDLTRGCFWKGRTRSRSSTPLTEIHAVQIIREYVRSYHGSFYSYELNLVLENGSRVNVVDHGSAEVLREQARTVAESMNVPVWDGSQPESS